MWWLKCHCVEPRLLAGWHGARCARITNATQTQKNPNSASATAQPPSHHPRPPPRRSHSHATGDQTSTLLRGPPATAAPPRKTKVAKSPQPQEPPAAPQHPPTAARGAGVGTQPPRPPHQATHRPERPTFYSHSPFPPATPRCWSCLPCSSPWSW